MWLPLVSVVLVAVVHMHLVLVAQERLTKDMLVVAVVLRLLELVVVVVALGKLAEIQLLELVVMEEMVLLQALAVLL
jgi:hypothetical protein